MERGVIMTEYINKADVLREMWNALYLTEDTQEEQEGFDVMNRFYVQKGFEAALQAVADVTTVNIVHCSECKHLKVICAGRIKVVEVE